MSHLSCAFLLKYLTSSLISYVEINFFTTFVMITFYFTCFYLLEHVSSTSAGIFNSLSWMPVSILISGEDFFELHDEVNVTGNVDISNDNDLIKSSWNLHQRPTCSRQSWKSWRCQQGLEKHVQASKESEEECYHSKTDIIMVILREKILAWTRIWTQISSFKRWHSNQFVNNWISRQFILPSRPSPGINLR